MSVNVERIARQVASLENEDYKKGAKLLIDFVNSLEQSRLLPHEVASNGLEKPREVSLPEYLKQWLEIKNWKQADLVRTSGVSESYISQAVRGIMKPSELFERKLARGIGLSFADFQLRRLPTDLSESELASLGEQAVFEFKPSTRKADSLHKISRR